MRESDDRKHLPFEAIIKNEPRSCAPAARFRRRWCGKFPKMGRTCWRDPAQTVENQKKKQKEVDRWFLTTALDELQQAARRQFYVNFWVDGSLLGWSACRGIEVTGQRAVDSDVWFMLRRRQSSVWIQVRQNQVFRRSMAAPLQEKLFMRKVRGKKIFGFFSFLSLG